MLVITAVVALAACAPTGQQGQNGGATQTAPLRAAADRDHPPPSAPGPGKTPTEPNDPSANETRRERPISTPENPPAHGASMGRSPAGAETAAASLESTPPSVGPPGADRIPDPLPTVVPERSDPSRPDPAGSANRPILGAGDISDAQRGCGDCPPTPSGAPTGGLLAQQGPPGSEQPTPAAGRTTPPAAHLMGGGDDPVGRDGPATGTQTHDPTAAAESAIAAAAGVSHAHGGMLADLLREIVAVAETRNPGVRASIAVATPDGAVYGVNEARPHISASAVKALWTAAAIDGAGLDAVAPLARPTLALSDNHTAGQIIDLIGIDAVNTWTREVAGLTGTHLACWTFDRRRLSMSALEGGGCANLTTAADLAQFYAGLHGGELLDPEGAGVLAGWLRDTPRGSSPANVAGALLARLPPAVAAESTHKAGWLPPGCCRSDHRLIIDAGGIPLAGGGWFAIAAVADRGPDYDLSVRWVGYAACRVYALLAGDGSLRCDRDGDRPAQSADLE